MSPDDDGTRKRVLQRACEQWSGSVRGQDFDGSPIGAAGTAGHSTLLVCWGLLFLVLLILSVACHYLGLSASMVYDGAYFIKS